jgi:hypothetical protein
MGCRTSGGASALSVSAQQKRYSVGTVACSPLRGAPKAVRPSAP